MAAGSGILIFMYVLNNVLIHIISCLFNYSNDLFIMFYMLLNVKTCVASFTYGWEREAV